MILLFQLFLLFMIADQPRQVLLFYNDKGKELLQKQTSEFGTSQKGMEERDILVRSYPLSAENAAVFKKWKISNADNFTFILVGRDGGEKYRAHAFVSHQDLFGRIDAMPMRKNEVGNNK